MQNKQTLLFLVFLFLLAKVESDDNCASTFNSRIENYCSQLSINSTHSCKYSNGKCDYSYKSCNSFNGNDEMTCKSIIPSSKDKKCELSSGSCSEVYKNCDEYEEGKGMNCDSLNAGQNKRCILNSNNQCVAHYNLCSNFITGVDKSKCEANIPSSYSKKCEWDESAIACKDVDKICTDYTQ